MADGTGFIRAEQIGGVWWLVDPDGRPFLSKGVNHVNFGGDRSPALGRSPYADAVSARYGGPEAWAEATAERLKGWGFNTIGSWSSHSMFDRGLAYTFILDVGAKSGGDWQKGLFPDVFADGFRQAAECVAEAECAARRDDPFLLGYFTDNELRWGPDWRSDRGLLADFWEMPEGSAGRAAAREFVRECRGGTGPLSDVWDAGHARWDDAFVQKVSEQYFRVCAEAIRRHDPNHMILGCRFAVRVPRAVIAGMAPHVDIVSHNEYDFRPDVEKLGQVHEWSGKPVMLTEFSFKALDSDLPCTRGAATPVATQQERADCFESYVTALMELPFMVGYHWFQYSDQPAEGRFDGENSNYGLVTGDDEPWELLTERMTAVSARIDEVHRKGAR
jgi:hypothetical protein